MGTWSEGYEGGAVGAALTTANTTKSAIVTSNGGTAKFSNAMAVLGSQCAEFTVSGTTQTAYGEQDFTNVTTQYFDEVLQVSQTPSATAAIIVAKDATGTALVLQVAHNTDGTLKLQDSAGVRVGTNTSTVVTPGQPFRVAGSSVGGVITANFFFGSNIYGATPDETRSKSGNTNANIGRVLVGVCAAGPAAYQVLVDADRGDVTAPGSPITIANATVTGRSASITLAAGRGRPGPAVLVLPTRDISITGGLLKVGGTGTYASCLAKSIPDDTSYIEWPSNPSGVVERFGLPAFAVPADKTGWVFVIRAQSAGAASSTVVIHLYQGASSTPLTTATFTNVPAGWNDFPVTLQPSEAAGVTDGTDVQFDIVGTAA